MHPKSTVYFSKLLNINMENENTRPEGWGSRGPAPKKIKTKEITGLEVGRGDNRAVVPHSEVEKLAAIGCTDREIAAFFGVKEDTLRRNFAEQLTKGREYVKTRLRMNLFRAADNLNPAVLIFLAKTILGMNENISQERQPLPWVEGETQDEESPEDHPALGTDQTAGS